MDEQAPTLIVEDDTGATRPRVDLEPAPSRARWPYAVVALLVAGILLVAAANFSVDYFAQSPGPAVDVEGLVAVADASVYEADGDLYLLTVSREEVNVFGYIEARWFDDRVELVPKEAILAPGEDRDEQRRSDLAAMEDSKNVATAVALRALGYEVPIVGDGAYVASVTEGGPSEGVLAPDDIIVAIDGQPIRLSDELVSAVRSRSIGDGVVLTVERGEAGERLDLEMELGTLSVDGAEVPAVGISTFTANPSFDFPVQVEIDSRAIGGPSAGLMYTLTIMNLLTEEDLTHGFRVAGTGTISLDGSVGAIGGVQQKVHGAKAVGAEVVLVPEPNYEAALEAAGGDVEVVALATLDDALDYLAGLG